MTDQELRLYAGLWIAYLVFDDGRSLTLEDTVDFNRVLQ